MIRKATDGDIKRLKYLYSLSFGDNAEYIDFYYKNCFESKNCLVYTEEDIIISSLFILDINFHLNGSVFKGDYIYAACTDPEYRSLGIMTKLIDYYLLEAKCKKTDVSILVPQEDSLFGYYEHFGYKKYFFNREFDLKKESIKSNNLKSDLNFQELNKIDFLNLRSRYLSNFCTTINYSKERTLNYVYEEIMFSKGKIFYFYIDKKIYYLVFFIINDIIYIKETSVDEQYLDYVLYNLFDTFGINNVKIRSFCRNNSVDKKYFGMIKFLSDFKNINSDNEILPYINLMLD